MALVPSPFGDHKTITTKLPSSLVPDVSSELVFNKLFLSMMAFISML